MKTHLHSTNNPENMKPFSVLNFYSCIVNQYNKILINYKSAYLNWGIILPVRSHLKIFDCIDGDSCVCYQNLAQDNLPINKEFFVPKGYVKLEKL